MAELCLEPVFVSLHRLCYCNVVQGFVLIGEEISTESESKGKVRETFLGI